MNRIGGRSFLRLPITVAAVTLISHGCQGEDSFVSRLGAAAQLRAQLVTVERIKEAGEAWFSWLTDQAAAGVAGRQYDIAVLESLEHGDLIDLLVPDYASRLVLEDGWGNPLEVRFDREWRSGGVQVMSIRSAGSDGVFEEGPYEVGPFPAEDHALDIVWADGFFVHYPGRRS